MTPHEILHLTGITKRFGSNTALDQVDFDVRSGEVHGLLGENGSGKSTLMRIAAGFERPDEGRITLAGRPIRHLSPAEAVRAGVALVAQEVPLALTLTVAENLTLGNAPGLGPFVSWRLIHQRAFQTLRRVGLTVDPHALVGSLGLDKRQLISIARALLTNPKVLVLDEATSSLSPDQVENLFQVVRELAAQGVGVVYISHRLPELEQITDRITVLRDGKLVRTLTGRERNRETMVPLMVGRPLTEMFPTRHGLPGEVLLEAENLSALGGPYDVSMTVRSGEIVGVAGFTGSGRNELLRALFGHSKRLAGRVHVRGSDITSPSAAVAAGLAYVPEDRKRSGLFLDHAISHNISVAANSRLLRHPFVNPKRERQDAERYRNDLQIRMPNVTSRVKSLSGGNQQKVLFARWAVTNPQIWLLDEPTRGVDVGAKVAVFELIGRLADNGAGVVLATAEMTDLLGMCDRILVMAAGKCVAELDGAHASEEAIAWHAVGDHEYKQKAVS